VKRLLRTTLLGLGILAVGLAALLLVRAAGMAVVAEAGIEAPRAAAR